MELSSDLSGNKYSKAEHRRNILPLLNNRSEGSVEFKHQNISAVLINMGLPFVKGYLPRFNYQKILEEKVLSFLNQNISIEKHFNQFASKEINSNYNNLNFEKIIVEPPKVNLVTEPYTYYIKSPIKIN